MGEGDDKPDDKPAERPPALEPGEQRTITRKAPGPAFTPRPRSQQGAPAQSSRGIVWLQTGEVARRLGITPRTLYRFIDEGLLPAYRFGRVIRLKESEVEQFIERSRICPGTHDADTGYSEDDLIDLRSAEQVVLPTDQRA